MKDIKTRIVRIITVFVAIVALIFGGVTIVTNYITAHSKDTMQGFTVAIILSAAAVVAFVLLTFFMSKLFAKKISEPISQIAHSLSVITDLDESGAGHGNEIEVLKQALAVTERNMNEYVGEISEVLEKLAQGDMRVRIESDFTGSFAQIKRALNQSLDKISQTLMRINESAGQVASGASQVAGGSQLLSQGAEMQATSVNQISVSVSDLSAKTQENTKNTNKVNTVAQEINASAELSSSRMESMLNSMNEIYESSQNIKKIIKVIEDISFQTNILALNAAVEAARAGAAGKGFAVVADEVRNLANKSAEAAHDTTELIEKSIRTVEEGNTIANSTAESISQMLTDIGRVTARIEKINNATNEQANAILEISQGLEQVSAVVQNNSATAQQSAAASQQLSSQAEMLRQYVTAFKFDQGAAISRKKSGVYQPALAGSVNNYDDKY